MHATETPTGASSPLVRLLKGHLWAPQLAGDLVKETGRFTSAGEMDVSASLVSRLRAPYS